MPELPDIDTEITATALRARRNELEQELSETPPGPRAVAMCGELAEIGAEIERLYLPIETEADARLCAKFGCGL
jgi:hypothetical protein